VFSREEVCRWVAFLPQTERKEKAKEKDTEKGLGVYGFRSFGGSNMEEKHKKEKEKEKQKEEDE